MDKRSADEITALTRCTWAADADRLMQRYHDREWGTPIKSERALFELLVLEGAQAGLSWSTVLRKRAAYRAAFARFDPQRVARYREARVRKLLDDAGLIRNRAKIESAVNNAKAWLKLRREHGSIVRFIWRFVDGAPRQNAWKHPDQVPTCTPQSDAMSAALRTAGFSFVGTTICYAFMQATGMVNDHLVGCFRWPELRGS